MEALDDTALRVAIDLGDAYDATVRLWRALGAVDGRMVWKTVKGRDYLDHVFGNAGSATSLGPRSAETQASYEQFRARKARTKEQHDGRIGQCISDPTLQPAWVIVIHTMDDNHPSKSCH